MPQINRIRVINFSYNDDTRHILDEIFNFHLGENAMLSLANGGGKTVMVQLFMQPVVPCANIQNRPFAKYFNKKKNPTYILNEWKLDDGGGYLLTGISFTAVESQSGEIEQKGRVKFFTFTAKYKQANAFDIVNLDVVERSAGVLQIKSFKEMQGIMMDKAKKDPFNATYFSDDDMDAYYKHLAEFGISHDEWKNIICGLNDHEGGLEEIFQKCKTSDQLLNEWFIRKTVEKSMFKDKSEARRLEEMMENLIGEIVENEQFIIEKQTLDTFLVEFQEIGRELEDLLKRLEHQKKQEEHLVSMYRYVSSEAVEIKVKKDGNIETLAHFENEMKRIDIEERSYEYLTKKSEYEKALERFNTISAKVMHLEEELEKLRLEKKILEATKLSERIGTVKAELSGIEEKLSLAKEHIDINGRIKCLEFSLKKLYETRIEEQEIVQQNYLNEKVELNNALVENTNYSKASAIKKDSMIAENARLEERNRQFDSYQNEVEKELAVAFRRNIMGAIDGKNDTEIRKKLAERLAIKESELGRLEEDKQKIVARLKALDDENDILVKGEQEQRINRANCERDIEEYEKCENVLKAVLDRYEISFETRFSPDEMTNIFDKKISDLKKRHQGARVEVDNLKSREQALKNGRLHVPEEILLILEELDVRYETGEAYLRGQEKIIRDKLLSSNPILPYSLIMSKKDLEKLVSKAIDIVLRQIIPICLYEDVAKIHASKERVARIADDMSFVCLYEGRMFEIDSLKELLEGIAKELEEAKSRLTHYDDSLSVAQDNYGIAKRFDYPKAYYYDCEKRRKNCEENLADIKEKKVKLENEKKELDGKLDNLRELIEFARSSVDKGNGQIKKIEEFFVKNEDYQKDFADRLRLRGDLDALDKEFEALSLRKDELIKQIQSVERLLEQTNRDLKVYEKRYAGVKDAKEAPIEEGEIEELEKKLEAIRSEFRDEVKLLEERKNRLLNEMEDTEKALRKIKIDKEQYANRKFDEAISDNIDATILDKEPEFKALSGEKAKESDARSKAEQAMETALEEVHRLGVESPLPPEEIKRRFGERRDSCRLEIKAINIENGKLSNIIYLYSNIAEKIASSIDISKFWDRAFEKFVPEADIEKQFREVKKVFEGIEKENRENSRSLGIRYHNLKTIYLNKNQSIDNIFKGLDSLWQSANLEFDKYYYIFERISQQSETLQSLIKVFENRLENLMKNNEDVVQQSFLHGLRVFEEVQKIAEGSSIKIDGKARPQQMIKVDMQLDGKEFAMKRIRMHIDSGIETIKEETRQGKRKDEVQRTIGRLMSSREMLNVFLGTNRIVVSVYKIDFSSHNSRMKTWEDAVRENSGGEKFVVFFSVLSALMTYARAQAKEAAGINSDKDSKVLIMDNPFGPISSEHLLKPFFEIAKKYKTQLICLSDLKQTSIMNCFNLKYMLKIRTSLEGKNEYLKFEEAVRNHDEIEHDEKLEKAIFRASDVKQISLFDINHRHAHS